MPRYPANAVMYLMVINHWLGHMTNGLHGDVKSPMNSWSHCVSAHSKWLCGSGGIGCTQTIQIQNTTRHNRISCWTPPPPLPVDMGSARTYADLGSNVASYQLQDHSNMISSAKIANGSWLQKGCCNPHTFHEYTPNKAHHILNKPHPPPVHYLETRRRMIIQVNHHRNSESKAHRQTSNSNTR